MSTYGSLKAAEVHYDQNGNATSSEEQALLAMLAADKPQHLFVMSHGWNNDDAEARDLYSAFFACLERVWPRFAHLDQNKCAVMAIFWPSKKFDAAQIAADGGAASLDVADPLDAALGAQLDTLSAIVAGNTAAQALLEHARAQIPTLAVSATAQNDFVAAIASACAAPAAGSGSRPRSCDFESRHDARKRNAFAHRADAWRAPYAGSRTERRCRFPGRRGRLQSAAVDQERGARAAQRDDVLDDEGARGNRRPHGRGANACESPQRPKRRVSGAPYRAIASAAGS